MDDGPGRCVVCNGARRHAVHSCLRLTRACAEVLPSAHFCGPAPVYVCAAHRRRACAWVTTAPSAPAAGMARRLPFTYGHAARALLLRLLLQPSRWGAQRTALSLTAVASAWCAARTRPAALAVAKLAQTVRQTASRTQTLAWAGTFAVLLLFVRDKRELLSLFLSADARARWRRRRELQHKLASCSLYSEFSALAAELESLLPPPRYAPSHGVRRPQLAAVSEYTVGTSILDSLCAGRALDEDTLVHLWTGLRAGLAAKATDIAVETLSERIAGRGAPAASPRSPQASDVRNTLRRLVFDVPDSTPGFGPRERAAMLEETLTICGRHALLLSGGGMLGAVHVGCVSALMKAGCLPHVIAGSSAGSIVAAGAEMIVRRTRLHLG